VQGKHEEQRNGGGQRIVIATLFRINFIEGLDPLLNEGKAAPRNPATDCLHAKASDAGN